MADIHSDPRMQYMISYGPDANCTLALCPIEASVYQYRPSLAANSFFVAFYGVIGIVQLLQMLKFTTWWYGGAMLLGCISEMIGYGGRIMLYQNPFSFTGFLVQIICVSFAPVFFTAAIYFTLSKIVVNLDVSYSRFAPKWFYYIFITSDIVSLSLQAGGGASSSVSTGKNKAGVNTSLAGLSFQVISIIVFIALAIDYLVRYTRGSGKRFSDLTTAGKIFASNLSAAVLLILARCAYRIAELHEGYTGVLIHDEPLFIALEGAVVALAAICLCVGHPGYVFGKAGDLSGTVMHPHMAGTEKSDMPHTSDEELDDKVVKHRVMPESV